MPRFINPAPDFRFLGDIVAYGELYFYNSGTNDKKTTYANAGETVPNANPVILDAAGRIPNIFFSGTAKIVLKTSSDSPIPNQTVFERDPVGAEVGNNEPFSPWVSDFIYSKNDIVEGSDGKLYISTVGSNSSNNPSLGVEQWAFIQFIQSWTSLQTFQQNNVAYYSGTLYKSDVDDNINNQPDTSPTKWTVLALSESLADTLYLTKANNFSDVVNKATARTNLDVYSKSESVPSSSVSTAATANTVAKRGAAGKLKAAAGVSGNDVVTFGNVTTSPTDTTAGRLLTVGATQSQLSAEAKAAIDGARDGNIGETTMTGIDPDQLSAEKTGFYHLSGDSTPAGGGASYKGITVAIDNNFVSQIAITINKMFFRDKSGGAYSIWRELYHTGNAVSTVSQSGGIPTGGIIESGSNANGSYTKFADGTMICRIGDITISGAFTTWSFPSVFSSSGGELAVNGNSSDGGFRVGFTSKTVSTIVVFTESTDPEVVDLTATGRWF